MRYRLLRRTVLDVSVVIPAYNRAATLGRAIASALAQTRPPREVVVVDDGSVDGTALVIDAFRERDPRVRAIRQANSGPGAARNTGIAASVGAWIGLLDSDDAWRPAKLENAAALVEESPPIDLIHSNAEFIESDGTLRSWDRRTPAEMTDPHGLMGTFDMRTSAVLVKRTLLASVGGGFPTHRTTCEDFELFWRLIPAATAIGYVASRDIEVHITSDGLTRINTASRLLRDNIATMGEVISWLQTRRFDGRYEANLRARRYWELRTLLAMVLDAGALRALLQDLRFGAAELSSGEAARAFASAGWSFLRQSS